MTGGRYLAMERGAFEATARAEANRSKTQNSLWKPAQITRGAMRKPCTQPGCPQLTDTGGKCPVCARAADRLRGKTADRGYDAAFRKLRPIVFARDGWRCVDCGWEPDIVRLCREAELPMPPMSRILDELRLRYADHREHLHADHEIPIEQAPALRLSLSNLRTRCNACNVSRRNRGYGALEPISNVASEAGVGPVEIAQEGRL